MRVQLQLYDVCVLFLFFKGEEGKNVQSKSVSQVRTICHIAARRMSPSAMFRHTPAAARDARRSAYEKSFERDPDLGRRRRKELAPRRLVKRTSQFVLGCLVELGGPEVCWLPLGALWKQHGSHRIVSRLSPCYSRVYNPRKSPWKAPNNFLQVAVSNQQRLCKSFCRCGSPNIRSFAVFLICFALFCFDSRRRLPSDVCLPLSGNAVCACVQWNPGKRSHLCDSADVNSNSLRHRVPPLCNRLWKCAKYT